MPEQLDAQSIPLTGNHLIEASAGTGKTYNITRLYLRLILEQKFTVEQILVMTFTKDATEEIRGRIAASLREALSHWHELVASDAFFQSIASKIEPEEAIYRLKQALLFLDEASIYTLHGYCKRVLSEFAFDSGLAFSADMESSGQELVLQATQDWYRYLAKQDSEQYVTICQYWPEPYSFIQVFSSAIQSDKTVVTPNKEEFWQQYLQLIRLAINDLTDHESLLYQALIDSKKGQDRQTRIEELAQLTHWLESQFEADSPIEQAFAGSFIDARRYSRSKLKAELLEALTHVNQVKELSKTIQSQLNKIAAYKTVKQGLVFIKQAIAEQKVLDSKLTFDDLIAQLAQKLSSEHGQAFADTLRAKFPVALVDEFQDTDPLQFAILTAMYPKAVDNGLFLIGDPKQAIYGFRGGDIFTYLSARDYCQYQWLMDTNWRSSAEMITGYNRLFYGDSLEATQGNEVFGFNIEYSPVKASPKAIESAIEYQLEKALHFVCFDPNGDKEQVVKQSFRQQMANWCALRIQNLLTSDETIQAQDIAILVRDGVEAAAIKAALDNAGLANVYLSNRSNLWHSTTANQLLMLLKGLLFVENDRFFIAALACGLLDYEYQKLEALQGDETAWQQLKFDCIQLRKIWFTRGFIAMAITMLQKLIKVAETDKDRTLTNLLHLFELLQKASERFKQPQELLYWFEQQLQLDSSDSEAELRLESDDKLIKIVTQHGSKGLEYPVVFVPFACRYKDPLKVGSRKKLVIDYHNAQGEAIIALGENEQAYQQMKEESFAETIRLLYVAVTRAERQCYMLVTNFEHVDKSPIGLTLDLQKEQSVFDSVALLAYELPEAISYQLLQESAFELEQQNVNSQDTDMQVDVAQFSGHIERDWWLSSFTALSKNLRHAGMSLPDRDIEEFVEHKESVDSQQMRFALEHGASAGNLLHDLLEHLDFNSDDWQNHLSPYFEKYAGILEPWSEQQLANWLAEIIHAKSQHGLSLHQIDSDKTLKESEFYFPMEQVSSNALSEFLNQHRKLHNMQSRQVYLPHYQKLKGMMHGFIDLIFEYQGKYYVADYKSNFLGDDLEDYSQLSIQQNIESHYYDLQYCIYSLALHRQLKLSLADYQPEQHFGGVYYFYLRGMSSANENQDNGIFYRPMMVEELEKLDDIFSGKPS